jgi:hypothetical protein
VLACQPAQPRSVGQTIAFCRLPASRVAGFHHRLLDAPAPDRVSGNRGLTIGSASFTIERLTTPPVSNANAELANSSRLELAGRWFLQSGIQEPLGGVARYYRSDLSSNARISTEITGYAASALAFLHSRTGDPRYLEQAARAGRFLTRVAWNSLLRAIPFEVSAAGDPTYGHAYFFDSGIVARALLALWRVSGEAEFLETARDCADSMATDFAAGPEFHPVVVLPSKEPAPRDQRWSRGPGCYQLKAALAWCELAEVTGRAGHYYPCYDRLLEYALATHAAFLPGEAERHRVVDRLHAYCYFLEGLLPRATQPDCAAALGEGLRRVADLLAETAPLFERSDVYAQLLRLRIFAAAFPWSARPPSGRRPPSSDSRPLAATRASPAASASDARARRRSPT